MSKRLRKRQGPSKVPGGKKRPWDVAAAAASAAVNAVQGARKIAKVFKPKSKLRQKQKVGHSNLHLPANNIIKQCTVNIKNKATDSQKARFKDGTYGSYQSAGTFSMVSGIAAGNLNVQKAQYIGSIWGGTEIGAISANSWRATAAWYALRPSTAASDMEGITLLKSFTSQLEFTNMEPTATFLSIYVLKSRVDSTTVLDPSTIWESSIDACIGDNPASTIGMPNATPSGQLFHSTYKIVDATHLAIGVGETRRHNINIYLNKVVPLRGVAANAMIKGITHQIMFVARGVPVDTDPTQAAGLIMYSPVKFIGVMTSRYVTKAAVKPSRVNYQTNNVSSVGAGSALYTMNDDTGASVNVATVAVG